MEMKGENETIFLLKFNIALLHKFLNQYLFFFNIMLHVHQTVVRTADKITKTAFITDKK